MKPSSSQLVQLGLVLVRIIESPDSQVDISGATLRVGCAVMVDNDEKALLALLGVLP